MAKKNEFTDHLTGFFNVVVDLNHLLHFMPWQLRMAKSTGRNSTEIWERKGLPEENFGTTTRSSVINIFHDGGITRVPAGKRVSVGNDVERMASEVEDASQHRY